MAVSQADTKNENTKAGGPDTDEEGLTPRQIRNARIEELNEEIKDLTRHRYGSTNEAEVRFKRVELVQLQLKNSIEDHGMLGTETLAYTEELCKLTSGKPPHILRKITDLVSSADSYVRLITGGTSLSEMRDPELRNDKVQETIERVSRFAGQTTEGGANFGKWITDVFAKVTDSINDLVSADHRNPNALDKAADKMRGALSDADKVSKARETIQQKTSEALSSVASGLGVTGAGKADTEPNRTGAGSKGR